MRNVIIPKYDRQFILKTDASDVGLGVVLMQRVDDKMLPVQWASKKLTPTETRYGISEKEMLAIFWAVKKFEYELRGRRFKIITDHKALENLRTNPKFKNNCINRWIELIQEFDFEIEYQKPENLIDPDALSRIFENEKDIKINKGNKIKKGKIKKHVFTENGTEYWVFGLKREYPQGEKRYNLCLDTHLKLEHRGIEATHYEMKKNFYWIGMKSTCERVIKNCETCSKINRKSKKGYEFIAQAVKWKR